EVKRGSSVKTILKNASWACPEDYLLCAVAKMNYAYKNTPNEHAIYDLGQAVSYLTIQATEMDLYLHQMGGFSQEIARKNLNLPDDFLPVAMIAMGFKGSLDRIPEEYQKIENNERIRNTVDSFAFQGVWKK
ncbi:MAG: nitroreductase family protein, partial [Salinivirgaceae bacterium]|nr:nitroreductase family protein [Salinivirgaceae bacterium]